MKSPEKKVTNGEFVFESCEDWNKMQHFVLSDGDVCQRRLQSVLFFSPGSNFRNETGI
jgi:hypothetical protein